MRTLTVLSVLMMAITVHARTIRVNPGRTLSSALTSSQAGDTVIVKAGTYREGTLTITHPLVLIGDGWPVIDGGAIAEVLVIKASGVTVHGFVITGTAISDINDNAGIKCISVKDITISGNRIHHCFFGVYLSNVSYATISGNIVDGDPTSAEDRRANGIHLWKCDHATIVHNKVTDHRDGIYFEFVTDSRVDHDTSAHNARYGLHFMFSHRDSYTHDVFHDNGAGVAVMFTHDVTMTDNTFDHNRGASAYGLLLKEINDAHIERNNFSDNTVGLMLDGCNRTTVVDDRFHGNGWAIRLFASSTASVFESNSFSGNTFDLTTNGDLVLSTLDGNYWDRYRGYDLDHDGLGDVPYRPLSLFALVTERMPFAMVLSRSLMVDLLDETEKLLPTLTPASLEDRAPLMRPPHG